MTAATTGVVMPVRAGSPLAAVAVGVLISAAMAVCQVATVSGPEPFVAGGLMPAYGAHEHPNQLTAWLALTVPLLAAVPPTGGLPIRRSTRRLVTVAAGAGAAALLLTQSRSGQLVFPAAKLVLLVRRAVVTAPGASRGVAAGSLAAMVAFAAIGVFEHVQFGAFRSMAALMPALGLSMHGDRRQGATA